MRTVASFHVSLPLAIGLAGCTGGGAVAPSSQVPTPAVDAGATSASAAEPKPKAACSIVSDPTEAKRLSIGGASGGIVSGIDAYPGEERELKLGHASSHAPFEVVPACARWSVSPQGAATIDAASGRLRVADDAGGKTLEVAAEIEAAGTTVVGTIVVVAASEKDFVGVWREEARLDCKTREWTKSGASIRELAIKAGGAFGVTWTPFESYVDYWGTWTWEPGTRKLGLTITGGNQVPNDAVTSGTMQREGQALVLRDVFLGTRAANEPRACGHRFVR